MAGAARAAAAVSRTEELSNLAATARCGLSGARVLPLALVQRQQVGFLPDRYRHSFPRMSAPVPVRSALLCVLLGRLP